VSVHTRQGVPEGKGKFVTKLGRGELVYEGELMQVSAPGVCDDVRALVQGRRCRGSAAVARRLARAARQTFSIVPSRPSRGGAASTGNSRSKLPLLGRANVPAQRLLTAGLGLVPGRAGRPGR